MAEVDIDLLADLLNYRRQFFKVCDKFEIPVERRGEHWVGEGINQKFDNYKTSYALRKQIIKQSDDSIYPLPDPLLKDIKNEKT